MSGPGLQYVATNEIVFNFLVFDTFVGAEVPQNELAIFTESEAISPFFPRSIFAGIKQFAPFFSARN